MASKLQSETKKEETIINTKDFIKLMSEHHLMKNNADINEASRMFNIFKDVLTDCLKNLQPLRLQKLFTVKTKIIEAHIGTNPKDRKPITVPSNAKVSIKISDAIKKQIMETRDSAK